MLGRSLAEWLAPWENHGKPPQLQMIYQGKISKTCDVHGFFIAMLNYQRVKHKKVEFGGKMIQMVVELMALTSSIGKQHTRHTGNQHQKYDHFVGKLE